MNLHNDLKRIAKITQDLNKIEDLLSNNKDVIFYSLENTFRALTDKSLSMCEDQIESVRMALVETIEKFKSSNNKE